MKNAQLFDKATIGTVELNNRIVMAPMTRSRANNDSLLQVSTPPITHNEQRQD